MQNKILFFLFFLIFCSKSFSDEQFTFNVSKIEILENGNKIVGTDRGIITSDSGINIEANNFENRAKLLRRGNLFELFILENNKKYLNITKKNINSFFKKNNIRNKCKIHYLYSNVSMVKYNKRIATEYEKLPLCNPDFIYLDGPDQFNIKGNINSINLRQKDFMPMSSDILKIEHFLKPGTIIVVDGRASNSRFLKSNFQRNWKYSYNNLNDQHIFFLNEKSLGQLNKNQLNFYFNK